MLLPKFNIDIWYNKPNPEKRQPSELCSNLITTFLCARDRARQLIISINFRFDFIFAQNILLAQSEIPQLLVRGNQAQ